MKQHQKLILALVILTIAVGGWWAWKMQIPHLERVDNVEQSLPSAAKAVAADTAPATQPQAANAPIVASAGRRKFSDMSARETIDIMRQIKATDADELLKLFLDAGRIDQDPMKQSMLQSKLVGALMEKKHAPDFITRMKRFVTDSSNSKLERGSIISAFASVRTKEATEFVFWALANLADPDLHAGVVGNIRGLGGSQPYLPAMIEPLWKESNEADLLAAVAEAMAREAAPSSMELLLSAAAAPDGKDDKRRWAAIWAIPKIYRADAVPALESALNNSPTGGKMNVIALSTLGQIGDKSASRAVIAWLQDTDKSAAPLVADWISRASGVGQLPAAEAALNPSVPFRSEENREAIRAALSAQRASTTKIGPSK